MPPPDVPQNCDRMPMGQRKAMLIDAIRQTQAGSEEDARDIIESLDETGRWYLKAFAALSKTRAAGLHPEPISLEEITAYMEVQELSAAPDAFIEVIQAMDRTWLDVNSE
jgi:hypothetical protein